MIEEAFYGNWIAVIGSTVFFLVFTLGFLTPIKSRDWRSHGIFTAFIISLFTEMFGIPLTIYFLSSVFGVQVGLSGTDGHMLANLLSRLGVWNLNTGVIIVMIVSTVLIIIGLWLIYQGWKTIHNSKDLVTKGIYANVRHPQYLGIMLITGALLIQWPTLPTLVMWPLLTLMYYRLAKREEGEMEGKYGNRYQKYKHEVPMFLPSPR